MDKTYAITHLVGTSTETIEKAIQNGIDKAGETLRNMNWFEVDEIRGHLGDSSDVQHYQVTLKIGFRYDE